MTGLFVVAALVLAAPQADDPGRARRLLSQAFDLHAELNLDSSFVLLKAARDADLSDLSVHLEYIPTAVSQVANGLRNLRTEYADLPDSPLIRCLRAYVAVSVDNAPAAAPSLMEMEANGESGSCPTVLLAGIAGEMRPTREWEGRRQEYLERALVLEPEVLSLWTSYASALSSAGRIEDAEEVLRRVAAGVQVHALQRIRLNMRRAGMMRARGDTASANALWKAVQVAVQRDGRPGVLLIYLRELGSVLDARSTADNELDATLRQTAELAGRYGAWIYEWYARYSLALRLTDRGEPQPALAEYDRIVAIADSVGIVGFQAQSYYKRGRALRDLGRLAEAELDLLRAVELGIHSESSFFLAEAYHNLFHLYDDAGRHSESAEAMSRFLEAVQPLRHSSLRMTAWLDAGEMRWKAGWHAAADSAFAAGIAVVDEYDEYHNFAGEYFERTGDLARARAYFKRGVDAGSFAGLTRVYLAMGQLDSATATARAHDAAMTGLADTPLLPEVLALKEEFPEAIRLAEGWVEYRLAGGSIHATSAAHLQLAGLLMRAADPTRALRVLAQADSLARTSDLVDERIEATRLRGLALAATGDTAGAFTSLRAAANDAALHPTALNIRLTSTALGKLLAAMGRTDDALAAFDRAAEQVTATTTSLQVDFDRVRYREQHLAPFDGAIETLLALPSGPERDLTLLRWSARRKAAALPESSQRVAAKRANAIDWSPDSLLNRMADGHALIDYLVSSGTVRAMVALDGSLSLHRLTLSIDSIASLSAKLREPFVAISGGRIDMARVWFDYGAAHELYRALFEPLLPALTGADRVTIIPDGPLHRIPFVALVSSIGSAGESQAASALRYLLDDYEVSYAPSVRHLGSADQSNGMATHETARILAVTYNAPGGESELTSIIEAWPRGTVHTLIADEATESVIRQREGSYDIVHYATHAIANDRDPLASFIGLASDAESDGLYHLSEIAGQPRDQALVILSGCETQTGNLFRGEGLMGLTRAFLASGAWAVVATQWPVGAATASLMGEFHTELAAGTSPATALRAAQMKLRADPVTSHPFYWAGFVLHRRD